MKRVARLVAGLAALVLAETPAIVELTESSALALE
jgi:hypothetical protein